MYTDLDHNIAMERGRIRIGMEKGRIRIGEN